MPGSQVKKPRTARSQPPACSHKEHDILTTAEVTAFGAQFLLLLAKVLMKPPLPSLVSCTASPQGQDIYLFTQTAAALSF